MFWFSIIILNAWQFSSTKHNHKSCVDILLTNNLSRLRTGAISTCCFPFPTPTRLLLRLSFYGEPSLHIWREDETFPLNDALQPFQVSQGQASTSPGSTMQTGFSSCTVGSLCVCVWLHMRGFSHPPPTVPPALHFDHSLFSLHTANWVCACVTHSHLRLVTLFYDMTEMSGLVTHL